MSELRYSRQREAILRELRSRKDHPTADMLYQAIKREYEHISLGTVYRNLALLCELGEIRKLPSGDGSDRYDGFTEPHNHFVCRMCGKVIDLESCGKAVKTRVNNEAIGNVEEYSLVYYGLCKDCIKK